MKLRASSPWFLILIFLPTYYRFRVLMLFLITLGDTHTQKQARVRTHTHSVGLLWTSDRPVVVTSTRQQTTLTRERVVHALGSVESRKANKRSLAHLRLIPRGHWNRLTTTSVLLNVQIFLLNAKNTLPTSHTHLMPLRQ